MLVIVLVTIALMGGFLPETSAVGAISPASIAILVFFLLGILGLNRARQRRAWVIAGDALPPAGEGANRFKSSATMIVLGVFGLASVVTLCAVESDLLRPWLMTMVELAHEGRTLVPPARLELALLVLSEHHGVARHTPP